MRRLINFSLCLALMSTSIAANAGGIAGPVDTTVQTASYEMTQTTPPPEASATPTDDDLEYRLEPKKKSTGKKVATGALIALGVVGAAVLGLLVFRRVQCGPGYNQCSE